jgi:hypothetical protein
MRMFDMDWDPGRKVLGEGNALHGVLVGLVGIALSSEKFDDRGQLRSWNPSL